MATTALCRPISNPRFPWALVVMLASVVVGIGLSHALKHGQDAIDARNCFDQHGNAMRWYNPFKESYVMVCQAEDGGPVYLRVLRRIQGKVEEFTAYRKDGVYHLEDMAKILEDQGAILEWVK